ncbi:hypothetical protein IM792_17390 [Mucilaginibacter sp. JRF]|uniref:hypothetical protein n=1 Tax=Mucilaginibacter sp. JRF TaxID=2780088 RepID=UPI00187DF363|nr:hypothetical protein [Mucilaginibacter sp. JRF]MBE9586232.1 hypothetical protein [Mucilaginibacter sp. JRF]
MISPLLNSNYAFRIKNMIKAIYTLLSILISNVLYAQTIKETPVLNQFQLTGDIVSFPLVIVNAFPFISGEINGVKGKLMFDTGNRNALEINNNIVPLLGQTDAGRGQVGSGQNFKMYNNDTIKDVKLVNGLHFQKLRKIPSANLDFLQNNITPDCIGYIGHDFFKGYLLKLDYTKRKLTFYKNSPQRESLKDFLAGEKVVAILNFEIRNLPNHPIIKVKANGIDILASFDTGAYGGIELTSKDSQKLKEKKYFIDYGKDGYDEELFILNNVKINDQLTTNFVGIYKHGDISHVRKALGITEGNYLTIAYRFLASYKTVWDYENKKIYVLAY